MAAPLRTPLPCIHPEIQTDFANAGDFLRKHFRMLGLNFSKDTERICIAWPQKRNYNSNVADPSAHKLSASLSNTGIPNILAGNIYENTALYRKCNQGILYALTTRQTYSYGISNKACLSKKERDVLTLAPLQSRYFLDNLSRFFIVVDHITEQGTTLANLASWLELQGKVVIAVFSEHLENKLQGNNLFLPPSSLNHAFNNVVAVSGRAPEIATALAAAARKENRSLSESLCLLLFSKALEKNSLFFLTNGECSRLIEELDAGWLSFTSLMTGLGYQKREISNLIRRHQKEMYFTP